MRGINAYEEAKQQGRLWTPALWRGDPRLVGWWDFSGDEGGLTVQTGVSTAFDFSSRGNALTQTTASGQPAYSSKGWTTGLKGAITPDGGDTLLFTTAIAYTSAALGMSVAAMAYNNASGIRCILSRPAGVGAPNIRFNGDVFELVKNFAALLLATPAGSCPAGPRIVGADFSSNSCVGWVDGTSYSNTTDPGFANLSECLFNDNGSTLFSGGPVGEFLISQLRWTVRERSLADGYLAWKWGHVSNLIGSHPFRNRPPLIGD